MTARCRAHTRSIDMRTLRIALLAATAIGMLFVSAPVAGAATTVRPGDQLSSSAGQCTANFVYTNGTSQFIGLAAHCFSTGSNTDTNGCSTGSLALGAPVTNANGNVIGTLAYSSWLAMKQAGERDAETCAYNDLSLVKLASGVTANPSVPSWGGPTALAPAGAPEAGKTVYTYGNSSLRFGVTQLSPKTGTGVSDTPGGWSHTVQTANPGIPGDSGSGFMDATGRAFGILSTVSVGFPDGVANGVGDLGREIAYANAHGFTVSLVSGGAFSSSGGGLGSVLGKLPL